MIKYVKNIFKSLLLIVATSASAHDHLSANEAFNEAAAAFDSRKFTEAFELLSYAQEKGSDDAIILMGLAHTHGLTTSDFYRERPLLSLVRDFAIANNIEHNDKLGLDLFLDVANYRNEEVWGFIGELYGTSEQIGIDYDKAIEYSSKDSYSYKRTKHFKQLSTGNFPLKLGNVAVGDYKSEHQNCDNYVCTIDGEEYRVDYKKHGRDYIISKIYVLRDFPLDSDNTNLNLILDKIKSKYDLSSEPTETELLNLKAGLIDEVSWYFKNYTLEVAIQHKTLISIMYLSDDEAEAKKEEVLSSRSKLQSILDIL